MLRSRDPQTTRASSRSTTLQVNQPGWEPPRHRPATRTSQHRYPAHIQVLQALRKPRWSTISSNPMAARLLSTPLRSQIPETPFNGRRQHLRIRSPARTIGLDTQCRPPPSQPRTVHICSRSHQHHPTQAQATARIRPHFPLLSRTLHPLRFTELRWQHQRGRRLRQTRRDPFSLRSRLRRQRIRQRRSRPTHICTPLRPLRQVCPMPPRTQPLTHRLSHPRPPSPSPITAIRYRLGHKLSNPADTLERAQASAGLPTPCLAKTR